jgi:hypothetical protein
MSAEGFARTANWVGMYQPTLPAAPDSTLGTRLAARAQPEIPAEPDFARRKCPGFGTRFGNPRPA